MHPRARSRAEHARLEMLGHVLVAAATLRGVVVSPTAQLVGDRWVVRCRISRWWWLALGIRHLVVRRRVERSLAAELVFWRYLEDGGAKNLRRVVESVVVT